jgi:hypothetical protein
MPRFDGARERIHQPIWDVALRGIGLSNVVNGVRLFSSSQTNSDEFTNLTTAGALQSDQTYVVKAIRAFMSFMTLQDPVFAAYGNPAIIAALNIASVAGSGAYALDLYSLLGYGCHLTFKAGEKDQFTAPLVYCPAGMGIFGQTTENARSIASNGWPSHENIMLLAKDIPIPSRQGIQARLDFFPYRPITGNLPGAGAGTTAGTGGNAAAAFGLNLDPLVRLNSFDGLKLLGIMVDGIKTRLFSGTCRLFLEVVEGLKCLVNVAPSRCEA